MSEFDSGEFKRLKLQDQIGKLEEVQKYVVSALAARGDDILRLSEGGFQPGDEALVKALAMFTVTTVQLLAKQEEMGKL